MSAPCAWQLAAAFGAGWLASGAWLLLLTWVRARLEREHSIRPPQGDPPEWDS